MPLVFRWWLPALLLLLLGSCRPARSLTYFGPVSAATEAPATLAPALEPRIQPHDLLSISLSSLNPESNVLFNSGVMVPAGNTTTAIGLSKVNDGYQVDAAGNINFPVLGKVALAGLTKDEATDKLTRAVRQYVQNPVVNVRYLNFRVTVLGEVNNPSTFVVPTEKISVLQALGLAGDLTVYGRRENVLVVREQNGVRTSTRLNLNRPELFASPCFYLQQNDVVYVEPDNRSKLAQVNPNNRYIPALAAAITGLALFLGYVVK